MDPDVVRSSAESIAAETAALAERLEAVSAQAEQLVINVGRVAPGTDFVLFGLTVFVLACFVGYYVVWRVTPALHSPLMSVTNAISSVIIVGALIAAGTEGFGFSQVLGFFAVILASVNIFGGFIVTQRMLQMYRKKR